MIGERQRVIPVLGLVILVSVGAIMPAQAGGGNDDGSGSGSGKDKGKSEKDRQKQKSQKKEKGDKPEEEISKTKHTVVIDGEEIAYTARAGTMLLKKERKGEFEPTAKVFYVAYTRDDVEDSGKRPITFSFNGGPGSSSVWLHLGALGPRRVELDKKGKPLRPPHRLVDNKHSLLDKTDLVFVDPVSTGYSRALPGEDPDQFHGVQKDIRSVGEFIRLFVTRNERWNSPKFLIGESYGTTRAAGLSGYLQQERGMYLNGIMLVSAVLNFQTIAFDEGNDLPYKLFLPSYTAAAWYHDELPKELRNRPLEDVLEKAEEFALGPYASALLKGSELSEDRREQLGERLARLTGLSENFIEDTNLRVDAFDFFKELLRDEGKTVGRFDSRYTGRDRRDTGDRFQYDPSYAALYGPFTATLNHYVRSELKFKSQLPYEILTGRVHPWDYEKYENQYVNVAETLRQSMTFNPYLKVFVANGYYDLATPYLASEYTFNHLGNDPKVQENISMGYYKAGHMMYVHRPSLAKLKSDLAEFIEQSVPERE